MKSKKIDRAQKSSARSKRSSSFGVKNFTTTRMPKDVREKRGTQVVKKSMPPVESDTLNELQVKGEQLHRLNRTLNALRHSNRAIALAKSEKEFLDEVCRIIIEDCGHAMVWIGYKEFDRYKSVRPVAYSGFEKGYLETLKITWADSKRGRGPTGTAVRTGKAAFCRNMLTDPKFKPWKKEAVKRGYASSLVIPLRDGNKVFGALTIYFKQPDPFTKEEVQLLTDLADDLAYGITVIRLREAHSKAEQALRESEAKAGALIRYAPTAIYELDYRRRRFISVNDAMVRLLGYTKEELLDMDPSSLLDEDSRHRFDERIKRQLAGEKVDESVEYRAWRKDGSVMDGLLNVSVNLSDDEPHKALVVAYDITERKKNEAALSKSESRFRLLSDLSSRLLTSENPQAILNDLCSQIMVHLDCHVFFNFLVDESDGRLKLNAYSGIAEAEAKRIEWLDYGVGVNGYVASDGEGIIADDAQNISDMRADIVRGLGVQAYCCLPLKARGKLIGTLSFGTKTRTHFAADEIDLMQTVADQVAVAMERVMNENKIRQAAQQWQSTFDSIPDMVSIQDKEFRLINVNKAYAAAFHKNADDLIGKKCFEIVHESGCIPVNCPHERTLSRKETSMEEIYEPLFDGYLEVTTSPLFDVSGELLGTVHVAKDISKRKRDEVELKRYEEHLEDLVTEQTKEIKKTNVYNRSLIEASLDPLVTISPEGTIMDVNTATEVVTGRSRKDLVGTDFSDYFVDPGKARAGYERVFRDGRVVDYPLEILHKDGHTTPVLYNATVYHDEAGKVTGVFAAARDITEVKRAENEVRKLNEELEKRVLERTAQLEMANSELEAFSYSVSHDLRTPLSAIASFSKFLKEDVYEKCDSKEKDYIDRVISSSEKMELLISALLNLSRISRVSMASEDLYLDEMANKVISELENGSPDRKVGIVVHPRMPIRGDQKLLLILMQNLIGNAWKFTRSNPDARIEIGVKRERGDMIFFVKDNGIGFDMREAGQLFSPFHRLTDAKSFEGTGIGLAIVKRIVDKHGGRIWAESKVNEGAAFYFTVSH